MRVFIAIPLSARIRKELTRAEESFDRFPAKWVEKENLHITLVFIGGISGPSKLDEISGVLSSIGPKPIELALDGLSLLPGEEKPHILAVKLTGETEKLSALAEEIKKGLRERRIEFDEKPFRPHITLARLKRLHSSERKKLRGKIRSWDPPKMKFKAKQIELTESKLTPTGPIYQTLKTYHLS